MNQCSVAPLLRVYWILLLYIKYIAVIMIDIEQQPEAFQFFNLI